MKVTPLDPQAPTELPCTAWRPDDPDERCPYCNARQSEPCKLERYDDDECVPMKAALDSSVHCIRCGRYLGEAH